MNQLSQVLDLLAAGTVLIVGVTFFCFALVGMTLLTRMCIEHEPIWSGLVIGSITALALVRVWQRGLLK